MKRIASVHAYDVLNKVVVSVIVREYPDYDEGDSTLVLERHATVDGTGEPEPPLWLQDALVALLETL